MKFQAPCRQVGRLEVFGRTICCLTWFSSALSLEAAENLVQQKSFDQKVPGTLSPGGSPGSFWSNDLLFNLTPRATIQSWRFDCHRQVSWLKTNFESPRHPRSACSDEHTWTPSHPGRRPTSSPPYMGTAGGEGPANAAMAHQVRWLLKLEITKEG